jgi:hypothetical protein
MEYGLCMVLQKDLKSKQKIAKRARLLNKKRWGERARFLTFSKV